VGLEAKIRTKKARIAVVGLGYAGLPLAIEFSKAGFRVTGIDTNPQRCAQVNASKSYIEDISDADLKQATGDGKLVATTEAKQLSSCDVAVISVPTPLRKTKDPDISYIVEAVEAIREHLPTGSLVVLESTTYPGTCEEIIQPVFEKQGLEMGKDMFLAFSPERVDPGNTRFKTRNIPKVVGGITPRCTAVAVELYKTIVREVVPVSSTRVAEMVKLLENTFRTVNISLINEFAMMCGKMGIDVWEVIDAAATKPFGFMPFYPGPGLGGHCLPVDPLYLSWKARLMDIEAGFIDLSTRINSAMPQYVVSKVVDALNSEHKCVNGSRILILGVSYKRNVSDTRESPAAEIMHHLAEKGAEISYCDPLVPEFCCGGEVLCSQPLNPQVLSEHDCAVIVTDHDAIDIGLVVSHSQIVVDTRNATKNTKGKAKVVKI